MIFGGVWGHFGGMFGGVLEVFLWYFGRFLGVNIRETYKEKTD